MPSAPDILGLEILESNAAVALPPMFCKDHLYLLSRPFQDNVLHKYTVQYHVHRNHRDTHVKELNNDPRGLSLVKHHRKSQMFRLSWSM